ncbi:energy transducer TonB [Gayadomonas joobiniege]|uniref:energy transducer TonB n=1 Tax=Gayadomonas joobiniege TaxID=1234606 RepID=UPI0003726849|nr:energy transducer TonB [Gayadomonas joobiniege]
MRILGITAVLLVISGCKTTPMNVCETYPGSYPANYTYIPDEIQPIVRIEPRYPKKAYEDGVTGFVKLSYSVMNGSVSNIQIIESSPEGVFDKVSIAALQKWKYQDTFKDCVQYPKEYKLETRLDFNRN